MITDANDPADAGMPAPDEYMTANERQVSVNLQAAISGVTKVAGAILEGRYKSIGITHLETAQMFLDKAIANDGIK